MAILIENVTAVLMDDAKTVLKNAYVTVEDTAITAVDTERPRGIFRDTINGTGKVLMPGLVNAHTHIPMTLLRGYGGGCDLQTWLYDYIFPAEAKLDDRAVHAGAALGLMELIASGVTTIADMYDHCDAIIEEVVSAGLSANISRGTTYFGAEEEFDFETFPACVELRELVSRWHGCGDGQILIDASIHGEYTSPPKLWASMADFAMRAGIGMHIHVSETETEHEACIGRRDATPVQALDRYGVWNVRALAAHCVWVTPEDISLLARRGVTVAHNPVSNLKLGSGIAPIPELLRAGVNVALGTDGVSSNNNADLFEEIKLAGILHNGFRHDPGAVTPYEALQMATVNGGKALGRKTGRIAPGYTADLILIDFDAPNLIPCHDVIENLVFSSRGSNVAMNMARGRVIYQNGEFKTIDVQRVLSEISGYALPLLFSSPER
ncbi:MAG: amidohydrolase [Oscillospiraceae bacterium]|nr:amidohydrolase [Oscillospiraceae bacterium]